MRDLKLWFRVSSLLLITLSQCFVARSVFASLEDQDSKDAEATVWVLDPAFLLDDRSTPPRGSSRYLSNSSQDFPDFRAAEWTLHLKPRSQTGPVVVNDIASADFELIFPTKSPLKLRWNDGSHGLASDFQPHSERLESRTARHFESIGGRSSDGVLPFFHLHCGDGGFIFAIGWSGDWKCSISETTLPDDQSSRVKIMAGLKHDSIRAENQTALQLPSILTMTYQGDEYLGQNQFRQLMLRHYSPDTHRPLELMPIAASVHGMIGFNDTTESNLKSTLEHISSLKLPIDTYWVDAGWNENGFPAGQGNPSYARERFPRGLTSLGKSVGEKNLKFLLWFEPERVMLNSFIEQKHPRWLLKPSHTPDEFRYFENDGFRLFNLANPEARAWMLSEVSKQISEWNVSVYRQDANIAPGFFWHTGHDPEDSARLEVEYINGLYAFLDELKRAHPKLLIDNCAAGGRRIDFELLKRSVVLWRSDSCWGDPQYPRNVQAMTMGLSRWLPLHGLGSASSDELHLRSGMGSCSSFAINYHDPNSVEALRRHLSKYLPSRHLFHGDFYPLSDWSLNSEVTLAYQFQDIAGNSGIVEVFTGGEPTVAPELLKLKGLKPESNYALKDWDDNLSFIASGHQLMEQGITIPNSQRGRAIVFEYNVME